MFNEKQLQILNSELDSSRVKTREKGNINLSYLEGFDIIETANKIFGYGNWSYSIDKLDHLSTEQNQNQNFVIAYKAIVKVIVFDKEHIQSISRTDVGTGTGISKTQAEAHEGATKEAVTDALKRAMRSFGNQFGLSLYDKSRNQNSNNNAPHQNQNYNNPQNQQHYHNTNNNQHTAQRTTSQGFDRYEFQSLYNLNLDVLEQNGYLIVTGDNQYAYRDAIKASGFKFDPKTKTWWRSLEQGAA